ncbi:Os02g0197050 [Oryza sativa Japonica Group]|uniref:Os02g0197050 protein n=1 Tax=Oryza sativa subsp. japonica TaxID=39947 RepID=A0A0N7KEV4_ORYSJ|nr:Os02g0197050 [Oryza sativa Japonica Group]
MGKKPKRCLLRHGCDNLRLGSRTVVSFLPNGPGTKSHNSVEPTTTLPQNFEPERAVPLMEGISVRGEALKKAKARKDSPPQLEGLSAPNQNVIDCFFQLVIEDTIGWVRQTTLL